MAPPVHDNNVREKVIRYIEAGNSQYSAAKIFKLSIMTVNRWYLRYKKDGSLVKAKPGAKSKINREELINHIQNYPDHNLRILSKKFGISIPAMHYWIHKLGYQYKKTLQPFNISSENK